MNLLNKVSTIVLAVIAVAVANATEPDSTLWLSDVTVTAIKQQSDMSLQPGSTTTLNGTQVRVWGVRSVKSLSEIAPNFYMPDYGSRMTSSIYVRGIGARMEQPVVGMCVDNVPLLNKDAYDFDEADVERIEVLRGPQSTLYGRNTMGGQINIYTLQPMNYQGTRVAAGIGRGPQAQLALSHYTKMNPKLAMGFVANFNFSDGFFKNYYNARKVDTEKGGRLKWKTQWQPSRQWSLDNVLTFSLHRQGGYPYEYEKVREINYNDTCFYRRNALTEGLTMKWRRGDVSVSSMTSVQYLDDNMTLDQDFLPLRYFTLSQGRHEWTLTQDFVVRGNRGNYSWIAGVFGFYKHTSMRAPVTLKEDALSALITDRVNGNPKIPVMMTFDAPEVALGSRFKIPVKGAAVYHQSTMDFGKMNVALGLRLDYESTQLDYKSICNTSFTIGMKPGMPPMMPTRQYPVDIDQDGSLSKHFLEFIPKLTISYELPMNSPSRVYASIGKGYKSGGYNTQMFSEILQQRMQAEIMSNMPSMGGTPASQDMPDVDAIVSYRPEKSWNYEVGGHIACADGKVMTDIALFYIDCRDQQLTMFPPGTTTGRITTNAGRTRSYGAELQIAYRPTDRWRFDVSYGYTNAKFVRFFDGEKDYRGNYVPYAPVNTIFASVLYTHPVAKRWELTYNVNCRAVGRIYWNEDNLLQQPMYALLGASVTARTNWIGVEAWMKNITATHYDVFYFQSMNNSFFQRGKPLQYGLTLRLYFDS